MVRRTNRMLRFAPDAGIILALLILTVPLPWLISWLLAAAIHELGHCMAVWICGGYIEDICIGAGGAEIRSRLDSDFKLLLCSLAGPAGGLFLLLFADAFPRIALCAFAQTAFNLLPIIPLDGGRALQSLMRILFPEWLSRKIVAAIEITTIVCILLAAIWSCVFWKLGMLPMLLAVIFMQRTKKIKIPCKWWPYRVQ